MRRIWLAVASAGLALASVPGLWSVRASAATAPAQYVVYQIDQTGTVDPLSARAIERAIRTAVAAPKDAGRSNAVLIRIDTPGGLDSSMRRIVQAVLNSPVPVICWVGPQGARAASAGAFILLACPVAAMAPGTNVGAAHPVGFSGEVLGEKITNDAAAYIRSLAERWGRNADWAEQAVRESVSISAQRAVEIRVADLMAPDARALFAALDGKVVKTSAGSQALAGLSDARVVHVNLTAGEALLHNLVDPNLAFLFFLFGITGIIFEVLHPGLNLPGVVGLILLVSSLVMFGMLPVNLAGVVLLAAAMAFFVIDLKVAGHGLPTAAGIISLVLGGLFLFNSSVPNARVSRALVIAVAVVMAAFFSFVVRAALRARHAPVASGVGMLVGVEGIVERDLAPTGAVRVRGESWTARSERGPIATGTRIRVVGSRGLTLDVEPAEGVAADVEPAEVTSKVETEDSPEETGHAPWSEGRGNAP